MIGLDLSGLVPFAHALVSKQDIPIPTWLFAWAASIVLIVSFFALAAGWRKPRFSKDVWRPVRPTVSRVLLSPVVEGLCGLIGVFLLWLGVYAGLKGTEAPDRNITLTLFYVTAWLGFPIFGACFGDFFRVFNPWRALGRAAGAFFGLISRQRPVHITYPEKLGRWPAAVGLVAVVWLEIVFGPSGGVTVGLSPYDAGLAALVYSVYTLAMISLFGTETWCRNGEVFSVYFGMFARLGRYEVREGRLGSRGLFTGTTGWAAVAGSVPLVIASIALTSFDGAQDGFLKGTRDSLFDTLGNTGLNLTWSLRLSQTILMLACLIFVSTIYLLGVRGMRTIQGAPSFAALRTAFAHTLIPIALAYLVAHYITLFVYQEQAQFTYLLSDPLGTGNTDLFGTATSGIDYTVLSANAIWYIQVAALVAGHVTGLTLAHDRALEIWSDLRLAVRSQYWMLAVMVGFTCFGLFLLSAAASR